MDDDWPRFTCPECGLPFAMPQFFVSIAKRYGREVYCPNGHASPMQTETAGTDERRLRVKERRIERLEQQVAWLEEKLIER
jgi:hypothetical protein